jgi:hypothetical protein
MGTETLTMLAVGDIGIRPQPEPLFAFVESTLKSADVVVCQGEFPYSLRGSGTFADPNYCLSEPLDPGYLSVLPAAGFNVVHLAGNHIFDLGVPGVEDTITELQNLGIAFCGAGMNIDEARRPAVIARGGTRFGFLSYNCTGPIGSWAKPDKPGCAYVQILTAYELEQPCPGARPLAYSFTEPFSLKAMIDDIKQLRPLCDILVVHFHKGVGFEPVILATYEQPLSYAAIDAGADMILGDHAHILKGIEQYKGKIIFHNLSHFGFPSPIKIDRDFIRHLGGPFFFGPGGKETPMPVPEAKFTMIARCTIDEKRISQVSYIPCLVNEHDQPVILKNDKRGQEVFEYVDNITKGAGLNAGYKWKGDEVVISSY